MTETLLSRALRHHTAGRPTILLVDDEPDILVALGDLLEEEYRILSSTVPEEALGLLAAEPLVSVILSDQRMPNMTGDVFLARARAVSDAEAILLTGYADLSAVVSALNDGRISGYAHKPWEPAALLSMVRQASERARMARDLRLEQMLLQGLMDGTRDGLSFKDREGRFVRINRAAAERLGAEPEACIGRTEKEIAAGRVEQAALERIARLDAAAIHSGDGGIATWCSGNGPSMRWNERLRGPLRDSDGSIALLASFERDITEQKLMEDRLRQADRMQALGTMASGVAHDFNNLLTAVLGSLELAQRAAGNDARLNRLLETAIAGAERGAALTQRLLGFSRQQDTATVPVAVNALVEAMGDLLVRSIDRRDIRFVFALQDNLPEVLVDPAQLELALLNLCINARDAMQDEGTITLRTTGADCLADEDGHVLLTGKIPEPGCVVVTVEDTGSGMTPQVAQRIFEPFFTTKEVGRGTGLGLSMVYGFIQQVGGAVRVRTAPGNGTSFQLCLPTAPVS
ncbi:ATP-binding protein [Acetobacteraceae bacterium KSS8]|uniref:histidine kinase n=1 Tax=Endosaccharibacter trunci TaxID=2812733 RepID=A0ABT1W759_9PROT|nr:ATP-binding protein [Acetobacteraceae bacterium KSS8]